MHIPLVDLHSAHAAVADEVAAGFQRVLSCTGFILGEDVAGFEREFADFVGTGYCVGVANGTDALELALRACEVGSGSEVILPVNTFIATAASVVRAGAQPVFVDCNPDDFLIHADRIATKVTPRTRAIVPVHLYGQMAPMEQIADLAKSRGLLLVEDAAQAHGATRNGRSAGACGIAGSFSFYPGKNLGAYGDAGAVVSNDAAVAERLRLLRNYGSIVKYEHPYLGYNSRLDTLQAVVLRAKLKHLHEWNMARQTAAGQYDELLQELPDVARPKTCDGNRHVYHLYVVRVPRRDSVLRFLHSRNIGAGIHYPTPLHLQGAFQYLGYQPGDFPHAERIAGELLSLPIYPGITCSQQEYVVENLREALQQL